MTDNRRQSAPRLLFVHSGSTKKRMTFEAAQALGAEIYLVNPSPNWADAYTRRTLYTQGKSLSKILADVEALHRTVKLDGVVTFWEEDVPTTALIAERLGLPGNTVESALNARSKYRMRQALHRAGVEVPPFRVIRSKSDLEPAARAVGFPAVIKPEWGSDSEWVAKVKNLPELMDVYSEISGRVRMQDCIYPYPTGRFVLEGYLAGPEVSVEGVAQNGKVTIYGIIDKAKMNDSDFIERGETTPSSLRPEMQAAVRDMVVRGAQALGLRNSGIHAEIKITPDGPRIVEIGARMGGDCIHALINRVYGVDLAEQSLCASLALPVARPTQPAGYAISTTLVPDSAGRVEYNGFLSHLRKGPNLIEVVMTKHPGDLVTVPPDGYDNLAWVSVWGKDSRAAHRSLDAYVRHVLDAVTVVTAAASPEPAMAPAAD